MYQFTSQVRFSELAEDKKLSIPSIINYLQDVCNYESEAAGVGLDWLQKRQTAWMLTSWQIKINRRPKLAEKITSTTWACAFRRFIGTRSFTLTGENDEMYAYAMSQWAYVSLSEGKPVDVPEEEVAAYPLLPPLEGDFAKGKIRVPAELMEGEKIPVTRSHIDTNHHVNNAQYVAFAMECLPDAAEIIGLRVEYKLQSKLGDVLYPWYAKTENGYIVLLRDEDGNTKTVVEFELQQ